MSDCGDCDCGGCDCGDCDCGGECCDCNDCCQSCSFCNGGDVSFWEICLLECFSCDSSDEDCCCCCEKRKKKPANNNPDEELQAITEQPKLLSNQDKPLNSDNLEANHQPADLFHANPNQVLIASMTEKK